MKLLRGLLGLLGVVLVVLAGVVTLQLRDGRGDDADVDESRVPLTAEEAPAMLADYDARNMPLARGSYDGVPQDWDTVDTGPVLAVDHFGTRVNSVIPADEELRDFTHELVDIYPMAQTSYPVWTLLATQVAHPGASAAQQREDADATLDLTVFVKDGADQPWRMDSWSSAAADLPAPLAAQAAAASPGDHARAAEVDQLLATWWEDGSSPGLAPSDDLQVWRADTVQVGDGVRQVTTTAEGWGGELGRTDATGPVRVLRVEGGLLVHTTQGWTVDAALDPGRGWTFEDDRREIVGPEPAGRARDVFAATVTVLVPDDGDAEVVAWRTDHVDEVP